MPKRSCGETRMDGGIYAESATSPFGMPLESFIIDSPIHELNGKPVMEALNLTARGVQVIAGRADTTPHIFDVVGADSYPDVLDFLEETRGLGASRRCELPPSEYARLIPFKSRILLIHPRAYIRNHHLYYEPKQDLMRCPKQLAEHASEPIDKESQAWTIPDQSCARLWAHDLTPQIHADHSIVTKYDGIAAVTRLMPCGDKFSGFYRHPDIKPDYAPAIFLSLPIARLVLVDPERKHEKKLAKLTGARVPVEVVDE
jgi:hypothetical protein